MSRLESWPWILAILPMSGCGSTSTPATDGLNQTPATPPKATAPIAGSASAAPRSTPQAPSVPDKLDPAACRPPPKGMVCIPAGPAVVGADDQGRLQRPKHTVDLSTFYIDRFETTNEQYASCFSEGACERARRLPAATDFAAPDQPAVGLTWELADAYCRWVGKRLPTEAEWEKVARGGKRGSLYPWGDEPPNCKLAHTGECRPSTTLPVGSLPAGAYDVHDLAGNGYEWVNDWSSACYDGCPGACGANCRGLDPQGPCGGAPFCNRSKMRVLKGGSWFWPSSHARSSWRRPEHPESGMHRLSVRCASSYADLATWPPLALTDPLTEPPAPIPPTSEQLGHFTAVVDDVDIFKVPVCEEAGGAAADCREPFSYIASNEAEQHLWLPYVENLGGGYVGIGADQSFSLIGAARSDWAWIFDYDPTVVRLHYILRAVIIDVPTPEGLAAAFSESQVAQTRALVEASLAAVPAERTKTVKLLDQIRAPLHDLYTKSLAPHSSARRFGWLRNAKHYAHVRRLHTQERILIRKGNLLTDRVMPDIAASARALGVTVRVLYLSNADDQWDMPHQYHQNILGLPFDHRTVVLRTVHPRLRSSQGSRWDYLVISGREEHRRMAQPGWVKSWWHSATGRRIERQFVAVELPGRTERDAQ